MSIIDSLIYYKEIIKNYIIRKWDDITNYELINGESNVGLENSASLTILKSPSNATKSKLFKNGYLNRSKLFKLLL